MNKHLILCLAVVVFALGITMTGALDAQTPIITRPGSIGFRPVATQAVTIATATPTIIGTMPPGARDITVVASGATFYYGDVNVNTTGTYPKITNGQSVTFTNITDRKPSIYFRALSTATAKIGIIAK